MFGPAWVALMADMDAPSIVAALASGMSYGYSLIFLMVLLVLPLYLVQEMAARIGLVTGKGFAFLVRETYGKFWSSLSVAGLFLVDSIAYVGEFAGMAAGAEMIGLSLYEALALAFLFHTVIVLTGSYKSVERSLVVVTALLLLLIVLAFMARPDPALVLSGFSPLQPYLSPGMSYMVVADVGAVLMPWMIFYQQTAVVDKGLTKKDLKMERLETAFGSVATQVLMIAVIVLGASASGTARGQLSVASMAKLFERLAGLPGQLIFAIGLMAAALLATVTISLASAYSLGENFGWPSSLNLRDYRSPFYVIYFVEIVPALVIVAGFQQLVPLMIAAMALNSLVLVLPLVYLVKLAGDERVMGVYRNGKVRQILTWALAVTLVVVSILAFTQSLRGRESLPWPT